VAGDQVPAAAGGARSTARARPSEERAPHLWRPTSSIPRALAPRGFSSSPVVRAHGLLLLLLVVRPPPVPAHAGCLLSSAVSSSRHPPSSSVFSL